MAPSQAHGTRCQGTAAGREPQAEAGSAFRWALPTDAGFESNGCGTWIAEIVAGGRPDPAAPFGDGTHVVGKDVAPGTWRAEADSCYWARLAGFSGELQDIITNSFSSGAQIVAIVEGDAGFHTSGCGQWTRLP